MKPRAKVTENLAGWPGDLVSRPARGPISQQPLHTVSSCQVHPQSNTYFGGIPDFLVISLNAPI
jgi:hypothetical protein